MSNVVIRPSVIEDLPAITKIYEYEVLNGLASFETKPPTTEELTTRRQLLLDKGFPYLVATIDNKVIGYAYASAYRPRAAYQNSIENSVYVDIDVRKHGIGKQLLEELITACEQGSWRQMIAVIGDSDNKASIALHQKLGFRKVGIIEAVGYKFDRWVDTVIMQRTLGSGSDTPPI